MPHVIRSPAIFVGKVVGIGGEGTGAVRIALGFSQSIIDVETYIPAKPAGKRYDQLILIEAAGGIVLKIIVRAQRSRAAAGFLWIECSRERSVNRSRAQQMQRA